MLDNLWLVPVWPLLGFLGNGFFGRRIGKRAVGMIACGSVGLSLLSALLAVGELLALPHGARVTQVVAPWIASGNFQADWGLLLDPLSAVMILVVSGVGFLIHVYSIGYMHEDPDYPRFFAYLNLFTFSMLMLVLANNYLLLYVFWEAVGLCSYLLIGFWFEKKSAADAGKKAFIVNRVGDFGFALGVMLLWTTLGTLKFDQVFASAPAQFPAGGAAGDGYHPAPFHGRDRQVGADAALRLVARRHGRSHAGVGPDPRRDHGDCRCLHGRPVALLFDLAPLSLVVAWSGASPLSSRRPSPWCRPTSSGCWPTPPSPS